MIGLVEVVPAMPEDTRRWWYRMTNDILARIDDVLLENDDKMTVTVSFTIT